MIKQINNWVNR